MVLFAPHGPQTLSPDGEEPPFKLRMHGRTSLIGQPYCCAAPAAVLALTISAETSAKRDLSHTRFQSDLRAAVALRSCISATGCIRQYAVVSIFDTTQLGIELAEPIATLRASAMEGKP